MKPLMLAKPAITAPPWSHCVELCKELDLGEIDSISLDHRLTPFDPFFDHLERCGYRRRQCHRYATLSLTYVNGSARWHNDPSLGPVVCWLLYTGNPLGIDAQLITRHGPLDMRVGDLCIFDANKPHAWLSNGICVMLMMTVAKLARV